MGSSRRSSRRSSMWSSPWDSMGSEWDSARTHDSNDELSEREEVIQFFHHISNVTRPTYELVSWLSTMSSRMEDCAIPLFRHRDVDYQIHPRYRRSPRRIVDGEPKPYHAWTDIIRVPTEGNILVIPFGDLFINKLYTDPYEPSESARRSKDTGYSVYLDMCLNIWLVFDPRALENRKRYGVVHGWFPARCHLFETDNPVGPPFDFYDVYDTIPFKSARVTLNGDFSRKNLTFENFSRGINDTKQSEGDVELQVVGEERACEMICRSPPYAHMLSQDQATDPTLGFSRPIGLPIGERGKRDWESMRTRLRPDLHRAASFDEGYYTSTSSDTVQVAGLR
ncbi:hypothetical protein GGR51DRAFT_502062 [Nemania sp. FL0031]|nr:hypothetical protein GGR51DRAFT_502062 [Nemania sp. FL0031]